MRAAKAAALALALAAPLAPGAAAAGVSPPALAALARRAEHDPAALVALRRVDRVGGVPVALGPALAASGPALEARLALLAREAAGSGRAGPSGGARDAASAILAERRFRGSTVPRPLHRPLGWLGRQLHGLGAALDRAYRSVSGALPGGGAVFWTLVGVVIAGLAAWFTLRLGSRARGRLVEEWAGPVRGSGADPDRLEREAAEAERRGDYERALRLRFQAGLLRLGRSAALPRGESFTNGQLDRRLGSDAFHQVARDFDEVVYGRRDASAEDAARARSEWETVVEEARRR